MPETLQRIVPVPKIGDLIGLPEIIEEAFKQKGPAIIGVPIDYSENMKMSKRLGQIEFPI